VGKKGEETNVPELLFDTLVDLGVVKFRVTSLGRCPHRRVEAKVEGSDAIHGDVAIAVNAINCFLLNWRGAVFWAHSL
jgi:hypothetical protein